MTDDIKGRLEDCSKACLESYNAWADNRKDSKASQDLQDAVHELRKIASRLEIELAASERDDNKQKHIPIPSHRDAGGRHQKTDEVDGNNAGNSAGPKKAPSVTRSRRRPPVKKADG
jgi:hypothetical protein